jgi:hypothetical protein
MICQNVAYTISLANTEFLDCFMGEVANLLKTYSQDSLVPRAFLINWPLVRLAHLCKPCTDHPCCNCSENSPGSSIYCLLSKYANRTRVLFFRQFWCSFQCLFLDVCQTCPISHFMHRNATAVYIDFYHVLHARMEIPPTIQMVNNLH